MKKEQWKMADGQNVPAEAVSPFDKKKEKVVQSIAKKAIKLNKELEAFKQEFYSKADAVNMERLQNRGSKREDYKGNYSLFSYDKSVKIEMNVNETVNFNDDIVLAQEKLNEYIQEITRDTNVDLQLLIQNAFKTRKGRLDKARIFSLFALNITHPLWMEAMELIRKAIDVNGSRRYGVVSIRKPNGEYDSLNLNFSSL